MMIFQNFINSKRGNAVLDSFTFILILIFLGMAVLIGKVILTEWNSSMQADSAINANVKSKINTIDTSYSTYADLAVAIFFFMFWIFMVVSSFMIDSHPIFFVFSLIGFVFVVGFSGYLGNMYLEFSQEGDISSIVPLFPISNYIISHIVMFVMMVGFSSLLAIFAKNRLG